MREECLAFFPLTLGAVVLLATGTHLLAQVAAPAFRVCPGTFALCTKAKC